MLFTGGEPTLYPEHLNKIVKSHPAADKTFVRVTSNGWYGRSEKTTETILNQIDRIDSLQMSFDIFHGNESKIGYVETIANYCKKRKIEFNVTMCLSNPLELTKAQKIMDELDVKVTFQPIITVGRAIENKLSFTYPTFQKETLNHSCPNTEMVTFMPGKGFSVCGSNLVFGTKPLPNVIHASVEEHENSSFYKEMSSLSMADLAKKYGIETSKLDSSFSQVCHLCEHIHTKAEA